MHTSRKQLLVAAARNLTILFISDWPQPRHKWVICLLRLNLHNAIPCWTCTTLSHNKGNKGGLSCRGYASQHLALRDDVLSTAPPRDAHATLMLVTLHYSKPSLESQRDFRKTFMASILCEGSCSTQVSQPIMHLPHMLSASGKCRLSF